MSIAFETIERAPSARRRRPAGDDCAALSLVVFFAPGPFRATAGDSAPFAAFASDSGESQMSCCAPNGANAYPIDTEIVLAVLFASTSGDLPPVDPAFVTLYLQDPAGEVSELSYPGSGFSRNGPGAYAYAFVPPSPGAWAYKWRGEGNVQTTSPDRSFFIAASPLLP